MNTQKKQQIQNEIRQLIRSIRNDDASDSTAISILSSRDTRRSNTNMFAVIASAMLLGAILMTAFIPLVNATKLFHSHSLPDVKFAESTAALRQQ